MNYAITCRPGTPSGYWVHWLPRIVCDHTFWPIRKVRVYYLVDCRTADELEFRDYNALRDYIKKYNLKPVYYDL